MSEIECRCGHPYAVHEVTDDEPLEGDQHRPREDGRREGLPHRGDRVRFQLTISSEEDGFRWVSSDIEKDYGEAGSGTEDSNQLGRDVYAKLAASRERASQPKPPPPDHSMDDEYIEDDAVDVLAIALTRLGHARLSFKEGRAESLSAAGEQWSDYVWSNGTDHDFGRQDAYNVMAMSPALRLVLTEGIKAVGERVRLPFGLRDRDAILKLEAELRAEEEA